MVSQFTTPLILEDDDDGLPMTLYGPVVYASALLQRVIDVPKGFVTDLASIPKILWNVLPPFGKYDRPAVVHDFLYRFNGVTRAQADAVLLEAMRVKMVPWFQRWVIYTGVRFGGWKPWNHYRRLAV